jgi:hypothetical protein
MAFSQYFATQVLNWVKGSTFPTALSNVYVSLHTGDPGSAGTSNDVTSTIKGSATRTTVSSAAFTAVGSASGGGFEITNTGVVQITTSALNSTTQTITHFGIWDASTGGNFLASGALTTSVGVELGDTVQFNIGAMAVRVI